MSDKTRVAVIGAGPMGLMCAYELLKQGHAVDLYEADDRIGGMSACFDFDGLKIERYYHFICGPDQPLFDLLKELELSQTLRWRDTKMGFFYEGILYKWGSPFYLLSFPKLGMISKLRYALHVMYTKNIQNWTKLDKVNATHWLKKWLGEKAYKVLWESLFTLKFFEYKDNLSAAWIGTRIKRVALSRKNLFTESLGYLEGGSDTLLNALEQRILEMGGRIRLNSQVEKITVENQQVKGVILNGEELVYERVVSTIPLPYVPRLIPALPKETKNQIEAIDNIGVVCVLLKLKYPLTENFWLNINDSTIQIPGLIEYSNLNPSSQSILYAPYYMPATHPKYNKDKHTFLEEVTAYLLKINPAFKKDWILASQVSRYEFAQTICPPDFYQCLPPMQTPITGFIMADTSYYYPEDRSISESVKLGKTLAKLAGV
ncbi:NAD(P)/FAD-dependent oxidoreductase [Candidatus Venteria ishoeyi]|uniref:15-cis-phytoene desaturase n=1 Tax=Candidatus Venteria ishoeyi TaxID=1899563 RepID=A0A1H6FDA7_9GAMM|nr:NAD(P)/FAD-dependent oxidoreductase [Candidatus Venteria ishoeyi]SEH07146.1 15-cis-phytoene desaturase [Candidatus Venteria ishoeyi]